jgi:curved DNA-binding protein
MKYKDYYKTLGLERKASADDIKKAYRKLAHHYHPDISKEKDAENKFKDIAEAYQTLKDPEKRSAYDQLGQPQAGQDFHPQEAWQKQYGADHSSFDDMDLKDLFSHFQRTHSHRPHQNNRHSRPLQGHDYEMTVHLSVEEAYTGTQVKLEFSMPERNSQGTHRTPHSFTARIPKGVTDGQRLCLKGQGGKGIHGGSNGDLYLNIALHTHPLFRVEGHDLFINVPLAPWEAVLGTRIELPTPGGSLSLKIPEGTHAGQKLRLEGRGLPIPSSGNTLKTNKEKFGDLYALIQIVTPTVIHEQERELFKQLAVLSNFNPRGHFGKTSKSSV